MWRKIRKRVAVCLLLCMVISFSLSGCHVGKKHQQNVRPLNDDVSVFHAETNAAANIVQEYQDQVAGTGNSGVRIFQAIRQQVDFDSELHEVEHAEQLFAGLPMGSEVTLMRGDGVSSDQLGMIEVPNSTDLPTAENSVNEYLQEVYDTVYDADPYAATKFENVVIWKNDVYVVFCITVNYEIVIQIINNTDSGDEYVDSDGILQQGREPSVWHVYDYMMGHTMIEIRNDEIQYTYFYEGEIANINVHDYDKTDDGRYTYYHLLGTEGNIILVVINDEMIVEMNEPYDDDWIETPFGVFDWHIRRWGFAENSEDRLPSSLNVMELAETVSGEFDFPNGYEYKYYANAGLLLMYDGEYGVTFYENEDGSFTYVEGISLIHAKLPYDAIITNGNYAIVDTL